MQSWSVPEVLRPLYESSAVLAQKTTIAVGFFLQIGINSLLKTTRKYIFEELCMQVATIELP